VPCLTSPVTSRLELGAIAERTVFAYPPDTAGTMLADGTTGEGGRPSSSAMIKGTVTRSRHA
jgi:hypothetical protein